MSCTIEYKSDQQKNLHRECLNPRADIVKLEEIVAGVKATQEKVKLEYEETIAAER